MRCAIWYHLYNLKNVKNTQGEVLLLVSKTPSWVFFTFFKLYKLYHIAQRITCLEFLNHTQVATGNSQWTFLQEPTHPLMETSGRGSYYNSQEFYLDAIVFFVPT